MKYYLIASFLILTILATILHSGQSSRDELYRPLNKGKYFLRVGFKIFNDQIYNDQYYENSKLPMLKVTRGPVIRFFNLRNYFKNFLLLTHSNFGF